MKAKRGGNGSAGNGPGKGGGGKLSDKKDLHLKEPSTPILFNQNSNSCSNDTNMSTMSSSTLVSQQQAQMQNPIYQKEYKVRNLLKELQTYVKKCHQERLNTEPNLSQISKMHERLKKEEKSTTSC